MKTILCFLLLVLADMLVIHAMQLAEELNAKLVTLDRDYGHMSFGLEAEKIKKSITSFLE